ncbi:MAG TPA: alpha/beta fold hydrolase, partial [Gemmiger formicilis]|nr:alpha/beta fold hydrolase [Gemmiger formicilis]
LALGGDKLNYLGVSYGTFLGATYLNLFPENIRAMVERLKYQVECFNDALPYRAGQSYGDRAASQIRVIYRIT